MNIVIDANILFAALIKDGFSYNIIFSEKFHLFRPEYIFTELDEHKEELMQKTERTAEEFLKIRKSSLFRRGCKNTLWSVAKRADKIYKWGYTLLGK